VLGPVGWISTTSYVAFAKTVASHVCVRLDALVNGAARSTPIMIGIACMNRSNVHAPVVGTPPG
jgi:hypothetical protein